MEFDKDQLLGHLYRVVGFLVVTGVTYLSMSGHISIAHSAVYTLLCAASMLIVDSLPTS